MKDLRSSIESIKGKLNLDGTEIYSEDGQTIVDIAELDTEKALDILGIKKTANAAKGKFSIF